MPNIKASIFYKIFKNNHIGKESSSTNFRFRIKSFLTYSFVLIISVPFIFPFWWMFTSSFKNMNEILSSLSFLPSTWRFQNFIDVFTYQPFAHQYFNSTYIAILVTIGTLIVSSLAGYGFARIRFAGNTILFILLLSAMMMPIEVTIIPNFFLFKALGLTNSHVPLIVLPILGSNGVLAVFMMRQFFLDIPKELEEAGMLDGLNRLGVFWYIVLPLAKPALGSVAILTFLFNWNSFLEPLVFINNPNLYTLPLALNNFNDTFGAPLWNLQLAAATLSVIPILLIYLLAQRLVTNTMALSGMK